MSRYDDILAVLRVINEHASIHDREVACNPCETTALAKAMDLEPQEVADRLSDAQKRGRMITARTTPGDTEPYFVDVRLTANGRAAVAASERERGLTENTSAAGESHPPDSGA